ncbi:MAG: FKBP-type peptidyl-prolyl cis-trans isomerase [Bacteroidaceae bacterium]|nr:FKBP-type peptidyl-prolyl cis-trans isomerase [Bacteroidaceae bacterium]
MKKILLLALVSALCLGIQAMPKKKKDKKNKKAQVEKVDTVDVKTFSYLIGRLNTEGLAEYLARQKGVDAKYMAQFIEGFGKTELTEADLQAKARIAGTEIREDVSKRVMPNISKQMNDSVDLLNHEEFLRGFMEGIMGTESAISNDSAIKIVEKQMKYYQESMMERKYGSNRKAGEEFLKANLKNKDIQQTASGLQYKIITKGEGPIPTNTQRVKVHYEGRLIDGKVFDSSYKRGQPATFGVNQVIKGWTEALTMMPAGSKWELYIPQELAYGAREQKEIPAFSCLIFTVELLEVVK